MASVQFEPDESVAKQLVEAAEVVAARGATTGYKLDFSRASMVPFEAFAVRTYEETLPTVASKRRDERDAYMEDLSFSFGAYLGEAIRRNVGGDWGWSEFEDTKSIGLRLGGSAILNPIGKVRKRLESGTSDEFEAFYGFAERSAAQPVVASSPHVPLPSAAESDADKLRMPSLVDRLTRRFRP